MNKQVSNIQRFWIFQYVIHVATAELQIVNSGLIKTVVARMELRFVKSAMLLTYYILKPPWIGEPLLMNNLLLIVWMSITTLAITEAKQTSSLSERKSQGRDH